MTGVAIAITALLAYLLGSIPFGLLLTRAAGLGDIRKVGSGNIGATNVLRTGHKGLAAATLLLDGGKGALAVLLARALAPDPALHLDALAGLAVVLGHLFPVWLRFRGGKGVATALGLWLALAWPCGIAACALWLAVAGATRFSSLAALVAVTAAAPLAWLVADPASAVVGAAVALLVVVRHDANIRRLIAGTEPRIGKRAYTPNSRYRRDGYPVN